MKKRIVISAIAATAMVSASAQINSPSTEGYYSRALHMYQDKNYNGCIDQMTHLLELNPTLQQREDADYYIAKSAAAKGDVNAKELLELFLDNYPTSLYRMDVIMSIGDCYFSDNDYASALAQYKNVDSETLYDLRKQDYVYRKSYCYLKLADYKDAEAGFKTLCNSTQYGNSSTFYCGYIAYVNKDYNEAMSYFNQVKANSELGDMTNYYKSQIYFLRNDYAKAQSVASKLLDKKVDGHYLAEANRIVGESLYQQGDVVGAIPYLKKYISGVDNPLVSSRYILGVCQYKNQDYANAIENFEYVTSQDNAMGQGAYLMIGQSMLKQGNVHAAMMALDKAVKMSHDKDMQEVAFYNYAVASLQGGAIPFGSSVANFEEFLRLYPDSKFVPKVQEYIVTGYMTDHNYERALSSIEKISNPSGKILSAKQRVLYSMGIQEYNLGNEDKAITYFIQTKELSSQDANLAREADLWLGNCYYRKQDYVSAAKNYKAFVDASRDKSTNLALGNYNLAYSYFQNKQCDEAISYFSKVVDNPQNLDKAIVADAYCRIADCQYFKRDYASAMKNYEKSYNVTPDASDYAMYQQAMMLGNQKDIDAKIKLLDKFQKEYPTSSIMPSALLEQAKCYAEKEDYNNAISVYKQITQNYPSTAQGRNAFLQLAIVYVNINDKEKAIETYKKVITDYTTSDEARVACEDLLGIYAHDDQIDVFNAFMSTVPNALPIERSELEEAAYYAAETAYYEGRGVGQLSRFLDDYKGSSFEPSVLALLLDNEYKNENFEQALVYANNIVNNYPDNVAIENALRIKAELEFDENKKELALEDYQLLEKRASSTAMLIEARLGIFRTAYDLNKYDVVITKGDELLASQIESDIKSEVLFKKAVALSKSNNATSAIEIWSALDDDLSDEYGTMSAVTLALYYFEVGNLPESRRLIEAFIDSSSPYDYWLARGYILLSDICRKEGNVFEANEYLRTLRANYPGYEKDIFDLIDERLKQQ